MIESNDSQSSKAGGDQWFTTTHWSVVLAAQANDSPAAQAALGQLCQTYWYPLYTYVRRQGYSPEDAQDYTQGFFERIIEKNYFSQVNRSKGRFRAFLLAAFKHYLSDQRDRERALKRGGGQRLLSLDTTTAEERYRLEPADTTTSEDMYERRWALTVMDQAHSRLREEWAATGRAELYDLLNGLDQSRPNLTYAAIGAKFGLTENGVKAAAHRMRQRFHELIRVVIAQTVAGPAEIDDEIRHLLSVISG